MDNIILFLEKLLDKGFEDVLLSQRDTQMGVERKLRRYIGPRYFDLDLKDEKDWFYVEIRVLSKKVCYCIEQINFDERDRIRMLSLSMGSTFFKEVLVDRENADWLRFESFVLGIVDEMDEMISCPNPYIQKKLDNLKNPVVGYRAFVLCFILGQVFLRILPFVLVF